MSFHWQATNRAGSVLGADDAATAGLPAAFDSQADAEEWLGENFEDLRSAGLSAVALYEGDDRLLYGPMGLDPA